MNTAEVLKSIDEFDRHYKYDSEYVRYLLNNSPEGLERYNGFLPMAGYIKKAAPEVYFVAKLAAMQVEDCGDCLQLNIRMALENHVAKEVVKAVIQGGKELPPNLKEIYEFAKKVANHEDFSRDVVANIENKYGKEVLAELALCIASAKVFPALRRTLGYATSCRLIEFEV